MKKILLLSTMLLFSLSTFAQDDDDEKGGLNGFRFGYQRSNLENSDESTKRNLDRFYVGLVRQKKFTGLFRLETGIEYMVNGAKITNETELELQYLVLPIQAHFKLGPFIATGGLNANFLLDQDLFVNGSKVSERSEDEVEWFDVAGDLGVGFKLWILTAEARYYYGFIDIKDGWHNSYLQAGLKFSF